MSTTFGTPTKTTESRRAFGRYHHIAKRLEVEERGRKLKPALSHATLARTQVRLMRLKPHRRWNTPFVACLTRSRDGVGEGFDLRSEVTSRVFTRHAVYGGGMSSGLITDV